MNTDIEDHSEELRESVHKLIGWVASRPGKTMEQLSLLSGLKIDEIERICDREGFYGRLFFVRKQEGEVPDKVQLSEAGHALYQELFDEDSTTKQPHQ